MARESKGVRYRMLQLLLGRGNRGGTTDWMVHHFVIEFDPLPPGAFEPSMPNPVNGEVNFFFFLCSCYLNQSFICLSGITLVISYHVFVLIGRCFFLLSSLSCSVPIQPSCLLVDLYHTFT